MSDFEKAVRALTGANAIVAATGAGMSKESGIPTFRDALDGLWAHYNPEELATREGFRSNPPRVWGWYNYRRGLIAATSPHAGHEALARLEASIPEFVIVTQNIDDMHRRAGSKRILELHGNINRFKCFEHDHPVDDIDVPLADVDGPLEPPTCSRCGSHIRPDVVWYGEMLPPGVFEEAERRAMSCDVMIVVGTSGLVYPAASLPMLAGSAGAKVIEINTERSEITRYAHIFLQGPAGQVLPELVSKMKTEQV